MVDKIGDENSNDCLHFPNVSDITSIFPSFDELHTALTSVFNIPAEVWADLGMLFPPTELIPKIPDLPSLPSMDCLFGNIEMPSMAAAYSALGIFTGQLLAVLEEMLEKLFIFISRVPYPKIPHFDFDLVKLMAKKPIELIKTIMSKAINSAMQEIELAIDEIREQVSEVQEAIQGATELFMTVVTKYSGSVKQFWEKLKLEGLPPMVPPIFVGFDIPIIEAITAVLGASISYVGMLIKFAIDRIKEFLKYLDDKEISYPSFPTLPDIPSFSEILDIIKGQLIEMAEQAMDVANNVSAKINSFVNDTIEQSVEMIEEFKDQITQFAMLEMQKFTQMYEKAAQNLRAIIDAMRNIKINPFNIKLPNPLFPGFDIPFIEMIYSYFAMVAQIFANVVKELKDYIDRLPLIKDVVKWPTLKDLVGELSPVAMLCKVGLNEKMDKAIEDARLTGQGALADSVNVAQGVANNATVTIAQNAKNASEMTQGTIDSASEAIEGSFDNMQKLANKSCSALQTGLGGLSTNLSSKLSNKLDSVSNAVDQSIDAVTGEVDSIVGGIGDIDGLV